MADGASKPTEEEIKGGRSGQTCGSYVSGDGQKNGGRDSRHPRPTRTTGAKPGGEPEPSEKDEKDEKDEKKDDEEKDDEEKDDED